VVQELRGLAVQRVRVQVYPTTRTDLVQGAATVEWSMTLWPQSWFRDPISGLMTSAFGGSKKEFVGRNVG
jgi:hypothetical protein